MIAFPHAPPRVENPELYWTDPPPERSARCTWWVKRMKAGWVGNKRIRSMGYEGAAHYFGVYYWEYLYVLFDIIHPPKIVQLASGQ